MDNIAAVAAEKTGQVLCIVAPPVTLAGRDTASLHLNYARSDDLTAHRRDPVGYRAFKFRPQIIENIA
jgi:hypothetical protein